MARESCLTCGSEEFLVPSSTKVILVDGSKRLVQDTCCLTCCLVFREELLPNGSTFQLKPIRGRLKFIGQDPTDKTRIYQRNMQDRRIYREWLGTIDTLLTRLSNDSRRDKSDHVNHFLYCIAVPLRLFEAILKRRIEVLDEWFRHN